MDKTLQTQKLHLQRFLTIWLRCCRGEKVVARIDHNVVYRSLLEDPANVYSLLLIAGYLKTPKKELQADGSCLCEVSIPNREIASVYKNEILSHLMRNGAITRTTANKIMESLYCNDLNMLQKTIEEYMDKWSLYRL